MLTFTKCFFLAIAVTVAPVKGPVVWPASNVATLSGKAIVIPTQLASLNILVVGFTKRSRSETAAWSLRLRNDARVTRAVSVYDVMVLDGVPSFFRSMIVKQVTSGVPKERH